MTRALHYVFKIGDRKKSREFFVNILKMKVLRHEEFEEGCKATCNGPYNGKWSKTMVGYGSENDHFVLELTYNYPISSYKLGNDFGGIYIRSTDVFENCKVYQMGAAEGDGEVIVHDPDGHAFHISPDHSGSVGSNDPVYKVQMNTSDLEKTMDYWIGLLGMTEIRRNDQSFSVSVNEKRQYELQWNFINEKIERCTGFGRIAFAVPTNDLESIQKKMENAKQKILTPLEKLDTPGKATVQVIILADPNDHEICFVGDEAFRELSQVDPDADMKLLKAIEHDDSFKYKKPAECEKCKKA